MADGDKMNTPPTEFWTQVAFIVTSLGILFRVVYTWINNQVDAGVRRAVTSLREEIEDQNRQIIALRARVDHLTDGARDTRLAMMDAYTTANSENAPKTAEKISKAMATLPV